MTIKIYGIKNCDTMKKAMKWLENQGIAFTFHDHRQDGLDEKMLAHFVSLVGWEALVNKRGTTFRALSTQQKDSLNENAAMVLMLAEPAMIKRPLLMYKGCAYLGFKPEYYAAIFKT